MKRSLLFLATTSALLTACDNSSHHAPKPPAEISTTMESFGEEKSRPLQVVEQAPVASADEQAQLRQELARLQAADPSVKDVYYGVGEDGERVLNVVREQTNSDGSTSISSTVWPLLGGLAAGALITKMIGSGGVSNFASHTPPARTQSGYSRDYDRNRNWSNNNGGYGGYQQQPKPQNYGSSDRNSFTPTKAQPATVQRTVAPSSAVYSGPDKTSKYYAPARQPAPSSNSYSGQSSYQQQNRANSAKLDTRIKPTYSKPKQNKAYNTVSRRR